MSDEHTLTFDEETGEIVTVELPADPPAGALVPAAPTVGLTPIDPRRLTMLELNDLGKAFAASGLFPDIETVSRALVKIMAGQELGIGPFAAMANIDIIKGQPEINSNLMRALVQRSEHYAYRIMEWDEQHCVMEWSEDGEIVGTSSFSMDDAKRAGLSGNNWTKFPKAMLLARATSQGARAYAPGIFAGSVYSEGELT